MVSFRQALKPAISSDRETKPLRVILPVSGGQADQRLIEIISKITTRRAVMLTLVFVVEVQQSMPLDAELPSEIERGESVLEAAERLANGYVVEKQSTVGTELLQARSAGAAIVDEAIDRGADMIYIGTTLRRKFGRVTIGETTDYVLKNAPCEVHVVRLAQPDWFGMDEEHET